MMISVFGPSYSVIEPMVRNDVFLPIFSVQESSKATDEDKKTLTKMQICIQLSLYLLHNGHLISSWLIGSGCFTMVAYVYLEFWVHRNEKSTSQPDQTLHDDYLEDMLLDDADMNIE
jgi:hypothetical protein